MRSVTARRVVVLLCMVAQLAVTGMGGVLAFAATSPMVVSTGSADGDADGLVYSSDSTVDSGGVVWHEDMEETVAEDRVVDETSAIRQDDARGTTSATVPSGETAGFGRDLLDTALRPAYDQVLAGLSSGEAKAHAECTIDEAKVVVHAVCDDHPELMRLRGSWSLLESAEGGVDVEPELAMTVDEERALLARCDEVLSGMIVVGESEHDTAWSVYEGLCARCEYDMAYASDQGMGGVLTHGRGVCAGYARAFQRAMHLCGIKCGVVRGTVGGESHMWDVAMLDGVWCVIDPTWGDGAFEGDGTEVGRARPEYFGMTDEEAARLGYVATSPAPACTSSAQDHVERCGWKLAWPDEEELSRVFWEQCATGMVVVKFADDASYAEAVRMAGDGSLMRRDLTDLATERGNGNLRYGWRTDDALRVIEVVLDL